MFLNENGQSLLDMVKTYLSGFREHNHDIIIVDRVKYGTLSDHPSVLILWNILSANRR